MEMSVQQASALYNLNDTCNMSLKLTHNNE